MTKRTKAAQQLAAYFAEQGSILSPQDYRKAENTPIRFGIVKKTFGSWKRMENIVRKLDIRNEIRAEQEPLTNVNEVLAQRNAAHASFANRIKAASENLEAKTRREQAAKDYIEADKLNATTAEGANENKLRKGGFTNVDAKVKKEAVEHAVAVEHALLARTGEGATLGKELLGGVEDRDERVKADAIEEAFREKMKLAVAEGADGANAAKLSEDDTDGMLTREAETRVVNEQRTYTPPLKQESVEAAEKDATRKVRDEVKAAVKAAAQPEAILDDPKLEVENKLAAEGGKKLVTAADLTDEQIEKMPPATRPGQFKEVSEITNSDGEVIATVDDPADDTIPEVDNLKPDPVQEPTKPGKNDPRKASRNDSAKNSMDKVAGSDPREDDEEADKKLEVKTETVKRDGENKTVKKANIKSSSDTSDKK